MEAEGASNKTADTHKMHSRFSVTKKLILLFSCNLASRGADRIIFLVKVTRQASCVCGVFVDDNGASHTVSPELNTNNR